MALLPSRSSLAGRWMTPSWCAVVVVLASGCVTTPESGRRAFILTSEGEEQQLGEQAYRDTLRKERLSTNPRWNAILQRVGQRVAAAANNPITSGSSA